MTPQARLCAIIERHMGCKTIDATDLADPEFLGSLEPDSMDLVELTMFAEEEFQVEIIDDEAELFAPNDLGTTRPLIELVALIEEKCGIRLSGEVAG